MADKTPNPIRTGQLMRTVMVTGIVETAKKILAEKILTFRPKHDIISILQTAYNWHLKNDKQKT